MFIRRFGSMQAKIFIVLVMGCTGAPPAIPPADIAATNLVRRKIGIREIKPTWEFYDRAFSEENWVETGKTPRGAAGYCKKVHRDPGGAIQWEEDYFDGVLTYVDANGVTYGETLTVHYDYGIGQFATNYFGKDPVILGLTSSLRSTSIGDVGATNAATLDVADKILAVWKKKRL